jgi:hypothetical protein
VRLTELIMCCSQESQQDDANPGLFGPVSDGIMTKRI